MSEDNKLANPVVVTPAAQESQVPSATWAELEKYPLVKSTVDKISQLPLVHKVYDQTVCVSNRITSHKYLQSDRAQYVIQNFLQLLIKLDSLLAVLIFNKGVDTFIDEWRGKRNGHLGIWIVWFFIDYLANCSNHILKELIIKPLNFKHVSTEENLDQDDANTNLPHLNELTSTTKSLSRDLQNKVQNDIVEPTKGNVKKQFDQYIKPTVDSAKETYKTVSAKYETNLKENDESIPKAIYTTGLSIGSETIEKLTQKKEEELEETKE